MDPFGDGQFLRVFDGAEGFGLGMSVNGVEDPVDMMCCCRARLVAELAAWQRCGARCGWMVRPVIAMEDLEAGINGTSLDG